MSTDSTGHDRTADSRSKDEKATIRQTKLDNPITSLEKEANNELPQELPAGTAYKRIFRYGSRNDHLFQIGASIAAIASGVAIALQTLIFGEFITTMNSSGTGEMTMPAFRRETSRLALYFVYLGIARLVLSYAYNMAFTYAAHRIVRNIRVEFLCAAFRQEIAFYDVGTAGSIATQASSNGQLMQGGIAEKLGLAIQGISAFFACFVVSMVVQWKLTLICLCIVPVALGILGVASNFQAKSMTQSIRVYMKANSFIESVLVGVRLAHAFEMRERLVKHLGYHLEQGQKLGKKISPILGVMFSSQFTIVQLGFSLAIWRGVRMLASGEIQESGKIFTVILAVILASANLTSLGPHFVDFSQAASAAAKIWAIIDRHSKIDSFSEIGLKPSEITGEIALKNVIFAYPTRPDAKVLHDLSLSIPAGKVTAFVGPSGSGKSTIIALLERWYDPLSGIIELDNQTIDGYNLHWLRTSIRLVQQEPVLFNGTILDNIRHGLYGTKWENTTEEMQVQKIKEAAQVAFAHDFILNLPDGYNTEVGQRGGLLSGGQKQRIAIARSIVSDPQVLLLDEATSALDPEAEQIVQKALDRASKGRTTIAIAHKLATIRHADKIVVLNKGKVVEQGTHEALLANDGTYARLVEIQELSAFSGSDEVSSAAEPQQSDVDDPNDNFQLNKSLTVGSKATTVQPAGRDDRYDYDLYTQLGIFSAISRIIQENRNLLWLYMLTVLSILGAAGAYPAQAILMSRIVPIFNYTEPRLTNRGDFFATMFVVLAAGCLVTYFTIGYATNVIAQELNRKYRKQIFQDILRQDLEFFDRPENGIGSLTSKADSAPQSILELMGFNIALIGVSAVSVVVSTVLAVTYSWKLGLVVSLAGLPPMLMVGVLKVRFDAQFQRQSSKRYEASATIASEASFSIRAVSSLAVEKLFLQQYRSELDQAVVDSTLPLLKIMVWFALLQAMEYWFMALGFWYGCRLLSFGEVEQSSFLVAFLSVFFAGQASAMLFQFSTSLTKGVNAANYIFWLHGLEPTIQPTSENHEKGPGDANSLGLDSVRFSYPRRPGVTVLKGLNITATKGQFVALVGASGCGKSTIISLLERFYDVSSGSVNIDTSALSSLNPRMYRQITGLVPQEPILFEGSVRDNVALGIGTSDNMQMSPDAPDADIEAALRSANAWDFVSSLPLGMDTQVGAIGSQLSGGQRQRIAIARALIRNPKILLLDEATSALDTESEKVIQNALDKASKSDGRITFAVAHRLSTIKDADMIYVFSQGRVVEAGTHYSLISQDSVYQKMGQAQSLA